MTNDHDPHRTNENMERDRDSKRSPDDDTEQDPSGDGAPPEPKNRILVSGGPDEEDVPDLTAPQYYLNREFSLLEFHRRVLHEVKNERRPLLHRVAFLAHFTRNMDEFFMKRIGGLKQQMAANVTELTPDGRNPRQQWVTCLRRSRELFRNQIEEYRDRLRPALEEEGIRILDYEALNEKQERAVRDDFESSILPILTPLTFDPAHPFPFISNLSLSLAVVTRRADEESLRFSRVKIPQNRPRLVEVSSLGGAHRFVRLEDVIAANLDMIFPYVDIVDHALFRVTRNAEVRRNEEVAEDLMDMIEQRLRERRFASVVRLDVEEDIHEFALDVLTDQLDLEEKEVFHLEGPLDYTDFDRLTELDRPDLKAPSWTPQPHPRLVSVEGEEETDLFAEIRKQDLLLHHPYHSFSGTVQAFLDQAAHDPQVLAVKLAIYRTAPDSEVISTIIEAANNDKQVAVMVELKARFDEENNLRWVERLEEEGIHVAYGTIGFKTHTKTAMVVREEGDQTRIYSHVATGNYHSGTAKGYEDLGLLTVDRDIGHDVSRVFHFFTGHSYPEEYRKLLVAPGNMRERFIERIRTEAERAGEGGQGRIIAKANRLEDPEIVRELYRASMAGVKIDLIIRDICRIRPGLKEVSENIRVRSLVGRFLEHSRIFYFRNGGDPHYLIGSADWMTRNLDRRVEAVTPVEDPELREFIDFILNTLLRDNTLSWTLKSDGTYTKNRPAEDEPERNAQKTFMERAVRRAEDARKDA